jgi:hypothetical protein
MVTYEIEEQKRRELYERLRKEWNAKFYSSTKRYSYEDSLTIEEQTRKNTKHDDDDDSVYTLFGIDY